MLFYFQTLCLPLLTEGKIEIHKNNPSVTASRDSSLYTQEPNKKTSFTQQRVTKRSYYVAGKNHNHFTAESKPFRKPSPGVGKGGKLPRICLRQSSLCRGTRRMRCHKAQSTYYRVILSVARRYCYGQNIKSNNAGGVELLRRRSKSARCLHRSGIFFAVHPPTVLKQIALCCLCS